MSNKFSHSSLSLFEACPLAYKFRKIDGLPEQAGDAATCGKIAHGIAERYIRHLVGNRFQTDYSALEDILSVVRAESAGLASPEALAEVWGYMLAWGQGFVLPEGTVVHGVEEKVAFDRTWGPCEFEGDAARWRGVIDYYYLRGDEVVVYDWKSNRVIPPRSQVEAHPQLLAYAYALSLLFPRAEVFTTRMYFLRYGKQHEVSLTREQLEDVGAGLSARMDVVDACVDFTPRVGPRCDWCGYVGTCPAMGTALVASDGFRVSTQADAEKAVELLSCIDRVKKELTDGLKIYVEAHGPVSGAGRRAGFLPTESVSFDDGEGLAGALIRAGVPRPVVWSVFSVTKTSLEKVLKRNKLSELLPGLVAQFGVSTPGTRFEIKKELPC